MLSVHLGGLRAHDTAPRHLVAITQPGRAGDSLWHLESFPVVPDTVLNGLTQQILPLVSPHASLQELVLLNI